VSEQSRSERRASEREAELGWWRRRRAAKKRRLARMTRGKRIARRVGIAVTWLLAFFALITTTFAFYVYKVANVPSPDQLDTSQTAIMYYADGSEMARFGAENRIIVPLSKVPDHVRWAVLAAEDRSFYSDPGVSVKGTVRAAVNDVTGGSRQGGSGITQQYVKNAYLNADQTLSRKLKELAIALKLSREYSKDQILEYYLNTIYFGRDTYGIEAAAEAYFGVPVERLTVSQGAVLAGLIKSPNYYDPAVTPAAAKQRWTYVLDGMVSMNKLTSAQRAAQKFPATLSSKAKSSALAGPLGMVKNQVMTELEASGIDASAVNTRGLRIYTTIDRKAEQAAQQAVADNFSNLTDQQKKQKMRPALTAVNPANGAVLAYYGGSRGTDFDYADGYRPPGSSFKPYTLATALQQNVQGKKPAYAISSNFNGNQTVVIQGTTISNDPSDAPYAGFKRLDYAMKVSLNTAFDGLADAVGPSNVAATAWSMGIRKTNNTGKKTLVESDGTTHFGIGIGDAAYSVRPLDQAVGFATIADGGVTHPAYFVQKVTDSKGKLIYQHKDAGTRSLDPRVANDLGLTLKPIADWSGVPLANGRESGAKTGTAGIESGPDAKRNSDAWLVGYTPQVSAAVWVGTDGSRAIYDAFGGNEYGRDLPGKTWKEFMDTYLADQPNQPLPTTQQILEGSNIQPTATPTTPTPTPSATSSTPSSSAAPSTKPTTKPKKTTPTPTPTTICTSPILIGTKCPPPPTPTHGATP
jgi:membrane peptidoglycan carboxypeptidase